MNYAARRDRGQTTDVVGHRGRHRRRADQRDVRRRSGRLARDPGRRRAVPAVAGTINTMLLVNAPVTPPALARTVVTMTEGKSAALQRLAVRAATRRIWRPAPAPISSAWRRRSTGGPAADVGQPAHEARRDHRPRRARRHDRSAALAERPRAELHARPVPRARPLRRERGDDLRRPRAAARRPPISSCCGGTARRRSTSRWSAPRRTRSRRCSIASRHGTLPASVARDALVQQAATLAASLAAQPDRWPEFRAAAARGRCGSTACSWCWRPSRSAGARSGARADRRPRSDIALALARRRRRRSRARRSGLSRRIRSA